MNRMIPKKCDIVVVGSGPAGTMAAGMLAKNGYDVVLLEKKVFPRNAVGESLIPHFWKFTDLLGASEAIEKEGFLKKKGGVVLWNDVLSKISFRSFGIERPALHVERDIFDNILADHVKKMGVSWYEEIEVRKVEFGDESKNTVLFRDLTTREESTIDCQYVVDASGQQAVIAKQEKMRDFDQNFNFQAVWGYYDQSAYFDQDAEIRPFGDRVQHAPVTAIEEIGNWGWSWHIVLREKVSIGIILPRDYMADFKNGGDSLDDRFNTYVRKLPMIGGLLKHGNLLNEGVSSVRDYAYKAQKLVVGNCYLTGDSAAFVDPVSSEGVPMSMYGGFLASWAINNSLKNRKRSGFYQELFASEYDKRLKIFKILAYPGKGLPPKLKKEGQRIIGSFSESEILLILAQSRLTGRYDNIVSILEGMDIRKDTAEVDFLDHALMSSL